MSNAIQSASGNGEVAEKKKTTIYGLIENQKAAFAEVLPKLISADEFVRVALTVVRMNPKLQQCNAVSLIGALSKAAQTGIMPDGVRAYLIPYKDEATYMVSYKGMIELAMRSGEVSKVESRIVCENDDFVCEFGTEQKLLLKPAWKSRGEMVAVYAMAQMKDGSIIVEVMSKEDVESIRKRSKAGNSGPWVTDYNEMARKTAVRRLAKYLPQAKDLIMADDDVLDDISVGTVEAIAAKTDAKTEALKDRLSAAKNVTPAGDPTDAEQEADSAADGQAQQGTTADSITKETAEKLHRIGKGHAKYYVYKPDVIDGLTESAAQNYLTQIEGGDFRDIPFLVKK